MYNAHVAAARARGRVFNMDLAEDQLAPIEGGGRLHRDAAPFLTQMLAAARADLQAARTANDALALGATSIGVGSAYRSATQDLSIREDLFPQSQNDLWRASWFHAWLVAHGDGRGVGPVWSCSDFVAPRMRT